MGTALGPPGLGEGSEPEQETLRAPGVERGWGLVVSRGSVDGWGREGATRGLQGDGAAKAIQESTGGFGSRQEELDPVPEAPGSPGRSTVSLVMWGRETVIGEQGGQRPRKAAPGTGPGERQKACAVPGRGHRQKSAGPDV